MALHGRVVTFHGDEREHLKFSAMQSEAAFRLDDVQTVELGHQVLPENIQRNMRQRQHHVLKLYLY